MKNKVDDEEFYDAPGYEEEGYEEEQIIDIPLIHTTHKAILATLISQKAMMEDELENARIDLDDVMGTGVVRTMGWALQVRYFLKANDTLRLTNVQILKTYDKYLTDLQNAMATIEKSGEDMEGLHKMISVLEIQNTKLELKIKQNASNMAMPQNYTQKEELPSYIQPMRQEKEEVAEETIRTEQTSRPRYGHHFCKMCGTLIRGQVSQKKFCDKCARIRKNQAKRDYRRRLKKKKAEAEAEAKAKQENEGIIP